MWPSPGQASLLFHEVLPCLLQTHSDFCTPGTTLYHHFFLFYFPSGREIPYGCGRALPVFCPSLLKSHPNALSFLLYYATKWPPSFQIPGLHLSSCGVQGTDCGGLY